jgi:hypothetical protein
MSDISHVPFREIAENGTLSENLKDSRDPARRLELLKEFRALLAEAGRIVVESAGDSWES